MKQLFPTMLLSVCALAAQAHEQDSVWVFTYNTTPKEGLHMAYSYNRDQWTALGQNHSFVKSDFGSWGSNKKMHDPSVLLTSDGTWYAVWAVNDRAPQFATTRSRDFWEWKPQDYPYMRNGETVQQPRLSREGDTFVVRYKAGEGYRRTESTDFAHWTTPVEISEQDFDRSGSRTTEARVGGKTYTGQIHRIASRQLQSLQARIALAEQRNSLYAENCGQDAERFKGIDGLTATLTLHPDQTKDISDKLIGIFFEDINYSADGGLYAELIQNRDFEYNSEDRGEWNAQSFWTLDGDGAEWTIATEDPIHENNPHYSLLNTSRPGEAALVNNGFDGIVVRKGEKYDLSLFLKGDGPLLVRLMDGDRELARASFRSAATWRQVKAVLKPNASAEKASLRLEPQKSGTTAIDFVSLFPQKTFKNRPNGLRQDLAQTLADLHPRFVRFPGGCVSHGNGLANMYRWRSTIGPLWERKSQSNIWGYHQSKGLGFYEYFQFCEDIGAEPLPVLPAGVPCQNSSRGGDGQQGGIPMAEMDAYVQELCDLIEWANGDSKTSELAKLRAQAGHPKPFGLKMLGVGNEDLISDVFTERFTYIYKELRSRHPEITVVGTVGPFFEGSDYEEGWRLAGELDIPIVDEHYYVSPGWYIHNQQFYDKYPRGNTAVYLGEWASRGNTLENALAEAVHLCNVERNADEVVMTSYAPLLAKRGHTQWNPDLIYFRNTDVSPTVNYHVQRLCGQNSGTQYMAADLQVDNGNEAAGLRVVESAVIDKSTGDLILKLVNLTPVATSLAVNGIPDSYAKAKCQLSVIHGSPADRDLKPATSTISLEDGKYELPPYSFSVLRLRKGK